MKSKNTCSHYFNPTATELENILEDAGFVSFAHRSNAEWIKSLESRLASQRRDFAGLLDQAAEDETLLKFCSELRRAIQETKRRLEGCREMQNCLN